MDTNYLVSKFDLMKTVAGKTRMKDAEATKTAILNAAEVEFARSGLLGARTEAIAEATGVTRAMIHYYYESKEQLYREVLERAFSAQIRSLQKFNLQDDDVVKLLESFLREFMAEHGRNVNLPAILLFEAVQNEGRFYKEIAYAAIYHPLCSILERGMKEGKFRKMDPMHTTINIVGSTVFYLCARRNLQHFFPAGTDMLSDEMMNAHMEDVLATTLTGILK